MQHKGKRIFNRNKSGGFMRTKTTTIFKWIPLGIIVLLFAGCGLIPIPRTRILSESIHTIEVIDHETQERIHHAQILCFYTRFENWANSFPPYARHEFITSTDHLLSSTKQPDGTFVMKPKRVTAYIKPVGITPFGSTIFDDYMLTISSQAEGYIPLSITYYPGNTPFGERLWENGSHTHLTQEGHFQIYLLSERSFLKQSTPP
jgi:hypothetical protein